MSYNEFIINDGRVYHQGAEKRPSVANEEVGVFQEALYHTDKKYPFQRGGSSVNIFKNKVELHLILFYSFYYVGKMQAVAHGKGLRLTRNEF